MYFKTEYIQKTFFMQILGSNVAIVRIQYLVFWLWRANLYLKQLCQPKSKLLHYSYVILQVSDYSAKVHFSGVFKTLHYIITMLKRQNTFLQTSDRVGTLISQSYSIVKQSDLPKKICHSTYGSKMAPIFIVCRIF